ncbi:lysozyme [Erythrobacter sp. sf7]|uniref:Lysozyme n=1 Tax=Erythrobacter fulvus TaxID=2987523 RepID=A0ABT5JNK6_9SPHN|nr:lysozyme [Erythrobacter fulvus]MDC8754094.1 lysozyme [Erythrobacter fulvus]
MLHQSTAPLIALIRRLTGQADWSAPDVPLPAAPVCQSDLPSPQTIGAAGIALIKRFEGCARLRNDGMVEAYPDPGTGAEPWTIGWGATGKDHVHGGRIGPNTVWSQHDCDTRLAEDLARYASDVVRAIGDAPTTQAQFDALVSFHYNTGAIARATLTARHRAGDREGAAREFARWNRAGGRVLKGLVRRRAAEAELYLSVPQ